MNNTRCVDEYANHVNNCVFNNAIAQLSLEFAVNVSNILNISSSVENPVEKWKKAAKEIKIPFDDDLQIHLEYDGYEGGTIKQADTTLLGFPLQYPMSLTVRANDINYYAPRTDPNGPAMTWSMYAIDYLELNELEKASQSFTKGYKDNIHAPYFIWWETLEGGAPNFITGAGGFLQSLLFGYANLRLDDDSLLILSPLLPPSTFELTFRMIWFRNNAFRFSLDSSSISLSSLLSSPSSCLSVRLADNSSLPLSNHRLSVPIQPLQIFVDPSLSCV